MTIPKMRPKAMPAAAPKRVRDKAEVLQQVVGIADVHKAQAGNRLIECLNCLLAGDLLRADGLLQEALVKLRLRENCESFIDSSIRREFLYEKEAAEAYPDPECAYSDEDEAWVREQLNRLTQLRVQNVETEIARRKTSVNTNLASQPVERRLGFTTPGIEAKVQAQQQQAQHQQSGGSLCLQLQPSDMQQEAYLRQAAYAKVFYQGK